MSPSQTKGKTDFYVDVHAHVLPDFYLAALKEAGLYDIDGWPFPDWSIETTLQAMDSHKIMTQVLSLSSPGVNFLSGQKAAQLARRLNEFQAKLVEDHAPRFGSLAVLPLPDVEASLAEIAYAFDTLGMDGVGLLSNYHGLYLGDPEIDAVVAELNRRKAVLFVHPTEPPNFNTFNIGLSAPVQEFVFDSTRMAQNLVQTGTKAKYPDITIIVAHGGGTLPYTGQHLVKYAMGGKNDIFNTFAFELTATTEPEQIRALMALADPTQCFMGFDHPFMKPDWWKPLQKTLEAYESAPGILRSIQNENAFRLFPKVKKRLDLAGVLDRKLATDAVE